MTRILLALALVAGLILPASAQDSATASDTTEIVAEPPVCGTELVTIARMQWPSAAILAHIHAEILAAEFGCAVQVVSGDLNTTTSSMATTGRPMVAPEIWLSRVAPVWNSALESGHVRQAAPSFSGGDLEGWFVPDYVVTDNPGLASVSDLMDHWRVFAGGSFRASFQSCPAEWACAVINRNLLRAHGLDSRFDLVEPTNRFEMDRQIAEAVSRREPILFYYWQPNGILSQLGFAQLDMGAYDEKAIACLGNVDCADPQRSAFPAEPVVIAISDDLFALAPRVASYFQRATMPLSEMNDLLGYMSENGVGAEDAARHFVDTRQNIWLRWLDR